MKNLFAVLSMMFFLFQVVFLGFVVFNGQGNVDGAAFFFAAGVFALLIYFLLSDPEGTE